MHFKHTQTLYALCFHLVNNVLVHETQTCTNTDYIHILFIMYYFQAKLISYTSCNRGDRPCCVKCVCLCVYIQCVFSKGVLSVGKRFSFSQSSPAFCNISCPPIVLYSLISFPHKTSLLISVLHFRYYLVQ